MNDFAFSCPTRFVFGRGVCDRTGEELGAAGFSRVLVVYGQGSVVRTGTLDRVITSLDAAGIAHEELSGVRPNPEVGLVREGVELARSFKADLVLGVGGGSVIDTAKAVAIGVPYEGDVWGLFVGAAKPVAEGKLPVACVLTIPAAGSESSASAVITNDELQLKRGLSSELHRPVLAIMDPELTLTLPPYQTAAGITDMIAHVMERFFSSVGPVSVTDNIACGIIRSLIEEAPRVLSDPNDYDARANVMWAGSLSHNGLTGCGGDGGDWSTHTLGHELSALYDVAHGAALTALWGSWARYVYKDVLGRFYTFAIQAMGVRPSGTREEIALKGIEAAEEWFRAIGLPTSIGELGITLTDEQVKEMARRCAEHCGGVKGSCRRLKERDMYEIYKAAL